MSKQLLHSLIGSLTRLVPFSHNAQYRSDATGPSEHRTWPDSDELERMTATQFEAHMRRIGMVEDG